MNKLFILLFVIASFSLKAQEPTNAELLSKIQNVIKTNENQEKAIKNINSNIAALQQKNQDLQHQIDIIKEINDELKKNYKLFQGVQVQTVKDVEYKVLSAEGNKANKEILITLSAFNNGVSKSLISSSRHLRVTNENGDTLEEVKTKVAGKSGAQSIFPGELLKIKITVKDAYNSNYIGKIIYNKINFDGMQINWK